MPNVQLGRTTEAAPIRKTMTAQRTVTLRRPIIVRKAMTVRKMVIARKTTATRNMTRALRATPARRAVIVQTAITGQTPARSQTAVTGRMAMTVRKTIIVQAAPLLTTRRAVRREPHRRLRPIIASLRRPAATGTKTAATTTATARMSGPKPARMCQQSCGILLLCFLHVPGKPGGVCLSPRT